MSAMELSKKELRRLRFSNFLKSIVDPFHIILKQTREKNVLLRKLKREYSRSWVKLYNIYGKKSIENAGLKMPEPEMLTSGGGAPPAPSRCPTRGPRCGRTRISPSGSSWPTRRQRRAWSRKGRAPRCGGGRGAGHRRPHRTCSSPLCRTTIIA